MKETEVRFTNKMEWKWNMHFDYLNEGNANGGASNDRQMVGRGEPKLTGFQTTLHVDDVIHIAQLNKNKIEQNQKKRGKKSYFELN